MSSKATMKEILEDVIENGRASTKEELENQFEFEASEQGWSDEETKEAIQSLWFPRLENQ